MKKNTPHPYKNVHHGSARTNQLIHASYSGPLPPPETLKGFETVITGAAERILKMAENESHHRHAIERNAQKSFVNNERLGMACALTTCLLALLGGFYCILQGHPAAGTILAATPLGIIVVAFIQGRK